MKLGGIEIWESVEESWSKMRILELSLKNSSSLIGPVCPILSLAKCQMLIITVARIPTLAPHFGVGMTGAQNKETQLVPIIGIDNSDIGATSTSNEEAPIHTLGSESAFIATQPPRLVSLIANELGIKS